jgi:hypothetical protein
LFRVVKLDAAATRTRRESGKHWRRDDPQDSFAPRPRTCASTAQHRLSQRARVLRLAIHLRVLDHGGRRPARRLPAQAERLRRPERRAPRRGAKVGPKIVVARSRDRGASWETGARGEKLAELFDLGADPQATFAAAPASYADEPRLDFNDANVLVASGATPDYFRPHSRAWIRVSTDGGHTWRPPIEAPKAGWPSLSGHASAIVRPDGVSLVFMTAVTDDGWKRRPVVYASVDGGAGWAFLSAMTPADDDGRRRSATDRSACASRPPLLLSARHRLPDGRILASIRCQRDPTSILWTEIFGSDDGGRTWAIPCRASTTGARPATCAGCTTAASPASTATGCRRSACACASARTTAGPGGREGILRDDGGSWDLGYPRVTEIEPGTLLTVYYMNRRDDPIQMNGGVRHIAQTVFTPA